MSHESTDELARLGPAKDAPLSEVQEWMALLLRHGRSLRKSEAMRVAAARHFSGNDRLSPAEQVDIYRQQFWLRHTSTLIEDFPGLSGLLGQKAWENFVEGYLTKRGYDVFALKNLGQGLAEHLGSLSEDFFSEFGVDRELLSEMAKLEWAYLRAFDLGDDAPLSAEKLAQIPPDAWAGARFLLSPTVSLFRFQYPVADLRRRIKITPDAGLGRAAEKAPHNLIVYRRERTLWDKRVSSAAFLLLEEFSKGTALVPACEAVIHREPSAERILEEQLTEWFTLWGRLGWIVDVVVPSAL